LFFLAVDAQRIVIVAAKLFVQLLERGPERLPGVRGGRLAVQPDGLAEASELCPMTDSSGQDGVPVLMDQHFQGFDARGDQGGDEYVSLFSWLMIAVPTFSHPSAFFVGGSAFRG
tara:strand:- start:2010 stop:2354 length:345 start_codon:yes stop_codon:yes gene_type:complete